MHRLIRVRPCGPDHDRDESTAGATSVVRRVVGEAQINDRRCGRLRDDGGGLAAATAAVTSLRAHDIELPETDRDKLFLPFQRLGDTSRKKAT